MSNKCIRCGKTLTDPTSVKRSMGPVCWGGASVVVPNIDNAQMKFSSTPISEGIILERRDGLVVTNVPWAVIHGSPGGFEWGYRGSGPSDLALNIIECILRKIKYRGYRNKVSPGGKGTCYNLAYFRRAMFKEVFLVKMPKEGGRIDYKAVKKWVIDRVVEEAREERHEY